MHADTISLILFAVFAAFIGAFLYRIVKYGGFKAAGRHPELIGLLREAIGDAT